MLLNTLTTRHCSSNSYNNDIRAWETNRRTRQEDRAFGCWSTTCILGRLIIECGTRCDYVFHFVLFTASMQMLSFSEPLIYPIGTIINSPTILPQRNYLLKYENVLFNQFVASDLRSRVLRYPIIIHAIAAPCTLRVSKSELLQGLLSFSLL